MALAPPQGLSATAAGSSRVNLSWGAVSGATGYEIERNSAVVATGVAGTTYTDTGLAPSTPYTYRVRGIGDATLPALPWSSHVGTQTSLAEEATFLADLDAATDRVRLLTLGASAQGRTIRAAIVGPPRTRDQVRAANTALIIGSIHGDEWAGREALFEFMRDHAGGTGTETYIWIPTLNPDGFSAPSRNLANGSDPNRLWSQSGIDQQTSGGAYFPEQQCLRQAILLWRPKLIFDTHEYTSTGTTYRFDPGTTNAAGTPQAVIDTDTAILAAMKTAATSAGYATANYGGAIPDDGMTQAVKRGGIPAIFTESPQESSLGLTGRRAMQMTSLNAFQTYLRANAAALASLAASATWYSGFAPTLVDA